MAFEKERIKLVDAMCSANTIKSDIIKKAFLSVKREEFFPKEIKEYSYVDAAFPIGYGQTISQPSTIAIMLELLKPNKNQKILEIGAGSGYVLCLLAEIVGKNGNIYGIDIINELATRAKETIKRLGYNNINVFYSDGTLGLSEYAPFDRILFSAACPQIPEPVIKQLNNNGIIVAPIGKYTQWMHVLEKDEKGNINVSISDEGPFAFVLLRGKYGFY